MKSMIKKIALPFEIACLIFKHSREYFLFFIPQVFFSALLPLLYVYAPKLIIEALSEGNDYYVIFKIIAVFCSIALILNLIISYLNKKISYCIEKFSRKLSSEVGEIVMNLSLSEIENTKERDNIRLASNVAGTIGFCETIRIIIQNIITIIGYIGIVSNLNVQFILIVIMLLLVKIVFTFINYKANIRLRIISAQNDRTGNYLSSLCYFNQGAAKEIRVNNIHSWFLEKVKEYRKSMVKLQYKEFKRNLIFDSVHAILSAVSSFLILWQLSSYYITKDISIADFTLYFATITALNISLATITDLIAQYNQQLKNVADYKQLKRMAKGKEEKLSTNESPFEIPETIEVCFYDVWFAYPESDDFTLRGINIIINNCEKLVVVGNNGAGKSTFIKLLCKFYRPTKGKITMNGIDIWDIPNELYYKIIGAVFQDFVTFAFTISENISMNESENDLSDIVSKAGLSNFMSKLPNGIQTYVSKKFSSEGIELSGGQGQKIALARALYKNAPILILDEPTASLDLMAESELYEKFMTTTDNKTAIFISHRLAASQIADHIAVFSNGKIVEYGTHMELLSLKGLYAEMFEKQSKPYILEEV